MKNINLEKLFNFCEENLENFKVEDIDESQHYYLNGQIIGGYAGDTRTLFKREGSEFLKAVKEYNDYESELEYQKDNEYVPQFENRINLNISTMDRGLGTEIRRVSSSKCLGYLDGPEDLIYDIIGVNNLQELEDYLDDINDNFYNSPDKPVYYIDDKKFASQVSGKIVIDDSFPKELMEKYNANKIRTLTTKENNNNTFSVFGEYHAFLYKVKGGTGFGSLVKNAIEFDSIDDAKEALKIELKGENVILDGKPFGENLPQPEIKIAKKIRNKMR